MFSEKNYLCRDNINNNATAIIRIVIKYNNKSTYNEARTAPRAILWPGARETPREVGNQERTRYCARKSGRGCERRCAQARCAYGPPKCPETVLERIEALCSGAPTRIRRDASRPDTPKHSPVARRDLLRGNAGWEHAEIP